MCSACHKEPYRQDGHRTLMRLVFLTAHAALNHLLVKKSLTMKIVKTTFVTINLESANIADLSPQDRIDVIVLIETVRSYLLTLTNK